MSPLTANQLATYHDDGFLVLPQFFDRKFMANVVADAERLLRRTDLIDERNLRCRFMPDVQHGGRVFEVFDPVNDISPACAELAADPRLLDLLEAIYGEPACLFKDKLIFKPPGALGYRLHQDWIAWPGFPETFVSVLVALDPSDATNGCTRLYAGVHKHGCATPRDGNFHELDQGLVAGARYVDLTLASGDVAIFGCFVPHCSEPNRSMRYRRQLFLSYNARSDGGDQRAAHYEEFRRRILARRTGEGDVYFR